MSSISIMNEMFRNMKLLVPRNKIKQTMIRYEKLISNKKLN